MKTISKNLFQIKNAILGLLCAAPFISNSQSITPEVINGTWQGILIQKANEYTDNYAYWVSLEMKGDSVFGVIRTEDTKTQYYALVNIRGKVTDNRISYTQDKIIRENPRPEAYWCLIKGELEYNPADNSLSGKWNSDMEKCKPGSLLIYKSPKALNTGPTHLYTYCTMKHVETVVKKKKKFNGYKVRLSEINFVTNSHAIEGNTATREINRIYALLNKNDILHVNIQGHTDNTGADDFNMRLSYLRAKEIYNLLIAKGVKADRITFEGYGKSRPVATNSTEKGKLQNRRVEIEIEMVNDEKITARSASK
jgi:outer membrane protein OmpA-like peptidoglycan-associated protein